MIEEVKPHNIDSEIKKAIHCGVPFAIWSAPGTGAVNFTFCNAHEVKKIYQPAELDKYSGFIFAPFQSCRHLPIYVLPFNNALDKVVFKTGMPRSPIYGNRPDYTTSLKISETKHINQVKDFKEAFKKEGIKKAVLARNKWIDDYTIDQMPALFKELNQNYLNAFVYQVFIPDAGYWVGATPELLFNTSNGMAKTVSLAGTQPLNGEINEVIWDNKEKIEQELVTEHIRSVIESFEIEKYIEDGPETSKAGRMVHIKTQVEFKKEKIKNNIGRFIEELHPTPAVCGLPVNPSMELILETEDFDREYYTGFLGVFNPKGAIDLYVNLRCLKAFDNGVVLFAGGGITPDSVPEKEWEETRLKIQTLEHILEQL